MKRRDFITLLGGAAAWPLTARAQQTAMPVIGHLSGGFFNAPNALALRKGLSEMGFVEGKNIVIAYRSAEAQFDRLAALAAELVRGRPTVIYTSGVPATSAAKAATATIPIVFTTGDDPVQAGFVTSFNRPEGNITGISFMDVHLTAKRFGLLHELRPAASRFAVLVNPNPPRIAATVTAEAQTAASNLGQQIEVFTASNNGEIDAAFASMVQRRVDALLIGPGPLFTNRLAQLATLAARHALPSIHVTREYVEAAGLMSYGSNISDASRQAGIYVGRILKGEKPSDLPVVQPTKFEFVINLQTARTLGIEVPPTLLALATEVIE
jgi:putative ABC transport system substrate-binding protein